MKHRQGAPGRWAAAWMVLPLAALAASARAQSGPAESAAMMKPAEGLESALWAAEPMVFNPTALDVDSRGRVWVAEGLNYRLTRGGNKKFARIEDSDKIKILEDSDGDGRADKVTVFADRIFPVPMGLAVEERYDAAGNRAGTRVYVGNSPNLLVLEDADGDDRADRRFNLLTGFGGVDSDHGVHGMVLGLDGKLYLTHGDGCCSVEEDRSERYRNFDVTDASGRRVRPRFSANTLRVNRDGTEFEVVCDGQRNNYETCINAFGEGFTSDNDDDGNRGCRVIHLMDGGNFGYRTPGSPRHWGEDVPGVVPKIVGTGNGSPCGIAVYESRLIPGLFGGLLEAEAGSRQILAFPLVRHGSSYRTETRTLLASDDPRFRPSDVGVGPDGSLFVADWHDAAVGGHGFTDQETGRIYRVFPKASRPVPPRVDFGSVAGLIEALKLPNVASQDAARRGLLARGDEAASAVRALAVGGSPEEAARALRVAASMPSLAGLAAEVLRPTDDFRHADPRLRELAVRLLGRDCRENGIVEHANPESKKPPAALDHLDVLLPLAADPDPGVRRELILALRNVPTPKVAEALRKLASGWDGRDRWYLEALGLALENREAEYVTSLMDSSLFGDPARFDEEAANDRVALPPYFPVDRNEAFVAIDEPDRDATGPSKFLGFLWQLQRPEALPVLESLLPRLKTPAMQQAGDDALTRIRSPYAADVAALLADRADDPSRRAVLRRMLAARLGGPWREARDRPPVVRAIEAALADPAGRSDGIAMAAASAEPRYHAALLALATDPATPDETAARAVEALAGVEGAPAAAIDGLIAAARDQGSTPRAEAAVRSLAKRPDGRDRALAIVADRGLPVAMRREAVRTAARLPEGGLRLIELARTGGLPDDLKTEATATLNASPDRRVREAVASVLPLPSTSTGRPLPPIEELLRREGDPSRGETVFFRKASEACASCHRVRGRGRWVGPDLSTIGVKYGEAELLNSILNPGAAIGYNFRAVVLALSDGRVVAGLPVEETPERIVLKTAEGERVTIAASDVEEKRVSETSLMPENLAGTMSDGELVDLLAFLGTLRQPVGVVGRLVAVGPIAGEAPGPDAIAGGSVAWRRIDADAEGRADLGAFLAPGKSAFARTAIVATEATAATLVLDGPTEATAWLNGHPVELKRASPDEPATAALSLPAGRAELLIRAKAGPSGEGWLTTTIVAPAAVAFDADATGR